MMTTVQRCAVDAVVSWGVTGPCVGVLSAKGHCSRVGYHIDRPWAVCDKCNYDTHTCPGCGTPINHGQEECDERCTDR